MDRLTQLRLNNTLNVTNAGDISASDCSGDGYHTANESLCSSELSLSLDAHTEHELSANFAEEKTICQKQDIPGSTPKMKKQIEIATTVSGSGVDMFDDTSNDGTLLVIDDNFTEIEDENGSTTESNGLEEGQGDLVNSSKTNPDTKLMEPQQKASLTCSRSFNFEESSKKVIVEDIEGSQDLIPLDVAQELLEDESSTNEAVLQIEGKNVNAIDIGNGLYLYRKEGTAELTALQLVQGNDQEAQFKFLKVRYNDEGNLEVYEEHITEVPLTAEELAAQQEEEKKRKSITCNKKIAHPTPNNTNQDIIKETLRGSKIKSSSKTDLLQKKSLLATNKEVPISKMMVDKHLPPNKTQEAGQSGLKQAKEILTVTTAEGVLISSAKLSLQPAVNKNMHDSCKTILKACTALVPFKQQSDIIFGNMELSKKSLKKTLILGKTLSSCNVNAVQTVIPLPYTTLSPPNSSEKAMCSSKAPIIKQNEPIISSNEAPQILTKSVDNKVNKPHVRKNVQVTSIKTKRSLEPKNCNSGAQNKMTDVNYGSNTSVKFDEKPELTHNAVVKETVTTHPVPHTEKSVSENPFVNKYISEALGVKNVTTSTINSLKTNSDKPSYDIKEEVSNNPKCNENNSSEDPEQYNCSITTARLINKTIDDIIMERLLAPSKPPHMVNADKQLMQNKMSQEQNFIQPQSKGTTNNSHNPHQNSDKSCKDAYEKANICVKKTSKVDPEAAVPRSMSFEQMTNLKAVSFNNENKANTSNDQGKFDKIFTIQPTKFQKAYQSALSYKMSKEPLKIDLHTELNKQNMPNTSISPKSAIKTLPPPNILSALDKRLTKVNEMTSQNSVHVVDGKVSVDKPKHQRKQILNPVCAPDLEIVSSLSDEDVKTVKKRKLDTHNTTSEKGTKSPSYIQHKKNYLLGRTYESAFEQLTHKPEIKKDTVAEGDAHPKKVRGRPRKTDSLQDHVEISKIKNSTLFSNQSPSDADSDDGEVTMTNWTMGKINENIVCPICSKLFRSESVVFKHVKHCGGPDKTPTTSPQRKTSPFNDLNTERIKTITHFHAKNENSSMQGDDTPYTNKSNNNVPKESPVGPKVAIMQTPQSRIKKTILTKNQENDDHKCEMCGKTFRQLSYLISHKSVHNCSNFLDLQTSASKIKTNESTILKCEICCKVFRKPYHLVQHKIIHSSQQPPKQDTSKLMAVMTTTSDSSHCKESSKIINNSGGFRCEECDKSFRKLHHLVEHREKHEVKPKPSIEVPTCEVCKKTFRKLHHLIEHREQHETKSADKKKNVEIKKINKLPKDIIHECSICYMVFPNQSSLNKHHVNCEKKRNTVSCNKNAASSPEPKNENANHEIKTLIVEKNMEPQDNNTVKEDQIVIELQAIVKDPPHREDFKPAEGIEPKRKSSIPMPIAKRASVENLSISTRSDKRNSRDEATSTASKPCKINSRETVTNPVVPVTRTKRNSKENAAIKQEISKIVNRKTVTTKAIKRNTKDASMESSPHKISRLERNILGKPKSAKKLSNTKNDPGLIENEDEVRYMINPMYEEGEKEIFFNIRSPREKRKSSTPYPKEDLSSSAAKIASSFKRPVSKIMKIKVESTKINSLSGLTKRKETNVISNEEEASKSKSLTVLTKRKNMAFVNKKSLQVKKPRPSTSATHTCDCGEKFNSNALLQRHTGIAHTPPRIRKNRSLDLSNESIKTIVKSVKKSTQKKMPHSGVPSTERMRNIYAKLDL